MRKGVLYGVGVGPGEPELLTLKAARMIKECDALVLPSPKESCRAFQIVLGAIPEAGSKELLELDFPMTPDKKSLEGYHMDSADRIEKLLADGKDVAFLTIGDPSVYSTFAYVGGILKERGANVKTVAGVASFLAASSVLGQDLVTGSEELHVYPGSGDIDGGLSMNGTRVFMKNKKSFPGLLSRLRRMEDEETVSVSAVSNCGTEEERVFGSAHEIPDDASYLTTVIVREKKRPVPEDAVILASKSPRRSELLGMMGISFEVISKDVPEVCPAGMKAEETAPFLAMIKAEAVAEDHPERVVIGADTTVILDGEALGKPESEEDAFMMLRKLSGRTHKVVTGVALIGKGKKEVFASETEVTFYQLSDEEIRSYIETGDPMDKAGAYGIQSGGARFVREIKGDYYTVVGLPAAEVARRLKEF